MKGLTLQKFVSDVCVCMFNVCKVLGFVDWLDRGLIYMWEEFRNVYLLMAWVWLSWGDPVWLTRHYNSVTTTTAILRWAAMRAILMFHIIMKDKVTRQYPQTYNLQYNFIAKCQHWLHEECFVVPSTLITHSLQS